VLPYSRKIAIYRHQTQLISITCTLHCYMFPSPRNNHQQIHKKNVSTHLSAMFFPYTSVRSH
jgi:hypothetical protein